MIASRWIRSAQANRRQRRFLQRSGCDRGSCGQLLFALVTGAVEGFGKSLVVQKYARRYATNCPVADLLHGKSVVPSHFRGPAHVCNS